jgi:hypothetical protein
LLIDINHNKCFFAKALPEPDFRYFSNAYALYLSGKEQHHTNLPGKYDLVRVMYPFE